MDEKATSLKIWDAINTKHYINCPLRGNERQYAAIGLITTAALAGHWPTRDEVEWPDTGIQLRPKLLSALQDAFDLADREKRKRIRPLNVSEFEALEAPYRKANRNQPILHPQSGRAGNTDRHWYEHSGHVIDWGHEPETPDPGWDTTALPRELRDQIRSAIANEGMAVDDWVEETTYGFYN